MKRTARLMILIILALFLMPIALVNADPFESFAENPIPYWLNGSTQTINVTHDSETATVTIDGGSHLHSDESILNFNETLPNNEMFYPDNESHWSDYADDMSGVGDWTQNVGETWGTDGDRMYVDVPDDAGSDSYYSDVISLPAGSYYYEYRVETNITASALISVNIWSDDGRTQNYKFLGNDQVGNVGRAITKKQYIDYAYDIECIQLTFTVPVDIGDVQYEVDYFHVGESTEMGWQHDCSTVTSTTTLRADVESDGDHIEFQYSGGGGTGELTFHVDDTTTPAGIDTDYYPFVSWNAINLTDDFYEVYADSTLLYSGAGLGIQHINVKASGKAEYTTITFVLTTVGESMALDWVESYSIANWTIDSLGDEAITDYAYVVDGELILTDSTSGGYIRFIYDPMISNPVDTSTFNVWNVSCYDTPTGFRFRHRVDEWIFADVGETRGEFPSGTLILMQLYLYAGVTISAIEFWEESELALAVPLERDITQSIEFMGNFSALDSTVRFQMYDNITAGLWCDVNSSQITFPDATYAEFSNSARINFSLDEERMIFKIYVFAHNMTLINSYSSYVGPANNDYLFMTDSEFEGSYTLWYLQGDIGYLAEVIDTDNIFYLLFLSLEMWGYLGPMALVVGGYFIGKKDKFLCVLWFVLECLFMAHYFNLVGETPQYWWHIFILLFGGLFTLIYPLVDQR